MTNTIVGSAGSTAGVSGAGYAIPRGSLATWDAAREASGSALCEVVWMGDSMTAGDCNGGATQPAPITQLMRNLSIAAGYTDGGRGAAPRGLTDSANDSGIDQLPLVQARSGFGTSGDLFSCYQALVPRSTTAGDTITFQGKGTSCRIMVDRFNNGGRWSYSVNGGGYTIYDQVNPTGVWQPDWVVITGLPGGGAINTVTVVNNGGRKLVAPPVAPSVQSPTTSAGPGAGTYFYVTTVIGQGGAESAASPVSGGATVNGSQQVNLLQNNQGSYNATAMLPTYGLYRATSSSGPFQYLKATVEGSGSQTTLFDDGTITPNAGRNPPGTSANGTDGGSANDVKVTVEFYNATGIVWHNAGISGATSALYSDVTDTTAYNPAGQQLLGLGPAATDSDFLGPATSSAARKPKLVVINFGVNDLAFSTVDTNADALADNLSLGIRMAQNAGASVLVCAQQMSATNVSATPPRMRQGAFRKAVWDVGISHGAAVVDLGYALGPAWNWGNLGYGPVPTNPHCTITGYTAQAQFVWNNVLSKSAPR